MGILGSLAEQIRKPSSCKIRGHVVCPELFTGLGPGCDIIVVRGCSWLLGRDEEASMISSGGHCHVDVLQGQPRSGQIDMLIGSIRGRPVRNEQVRRALCSPVPIVLVLCDERQSKRE
jgi:hypothetical protein